MNKLLLSVYLAITFLLSACGGSGEDEPAPVISSFTASLSEITIGEEVKLTAVFSNGQGTIDVGISNINSGDSKAVRPNNTTT